MYKRILVPLDGSSLSELVLPHAQLLARHFQATIELLYVVETEDIPEDITTEIEENGVAYLLRIADTIADALHPNCVVRQGNAAEVILDQAEQNGDKRTLVVMTTHGYSGVQRWFLGSVAHKVIQATNTPILLIPAGAKNPQGGPVEFERAIVPLDGSEMAECVLPSVVALCKELDMELILVRVYNPRFPGSSVRMHEISKIVHDSAENYLKSKVEELSGEGLKSVAYKALRGIPAQRITDFAIETPNSLTAMCTHGRHGLGRWVLGSVTDAVIHCMEEPVWILRGCPPEQST